MIAQSEIRRIANVNAFARGTELYYKNNVYNLEVTADAHHNEITAQVKGSEGNIYHVYAAIGEEDGAIIDVDCECPAFYSYAGACKHCVAVLLEYNIHQKRKLLAQGAALKKEQMVRELQRMREKRVGTTPAMKHLLSHRRVVQMSPFLEQDTYGKVQIEPFLKCNTRECLVEFKIGMKPFYVMKDIFSFASLFEQQGEYMYGKKLQFVHSEGAFAPESLPLARFIYRWVERNGQRYMHSGHHSYYYTNATPKLRTISLSLEELEEFLEAMRERELIADIELTGEKVWRIVEAEPTRRLRVEGKEEGIEIRVNKNSLYITPNYCVYFDHQKIYLSKRERLLAIQDFIFCMDEAQENKVFIETADVPAFCRELLPLLEQYYECKLVNFKVESYGVQALKVEIYLDILKKNMVTCKALAVYGRERYPLYDDHEDHKFERDMVKEIAIQQRIFPFFSEYDKEEKKLVITEDEEKLYELLVYGIPKLQELGQVFVSDTLKNMKITNAPKVKVGISLAGNMLELEVTSDEMPREQLMELLSRYNRKKKYYRLKNGDFVNVENDNIAALLELQQGLQLTDKQLRQDVLQIPSFRALYLDAELRGWRSLSVRKDRNFKALIRNMKTVEDSDFELPKTLEKILREYQKRGFLWIKTLKANGLGGILADEMGLGKTLQIISFLLSEFQAAKAEENRRCLVVAPASLVYNWKNEFEKFAPELSVKLVVGTSEERKEIIQAAELRDILITSYDLLRRDTSEYQEISFFTQVIDEAQFIKNHSTKGARAVKAITAEFKMALTGTPVENRLSELWSIFDYLLPGFLFSYKKFREEFEIPIIQNDDEQAMKRIQKMIGPFVLRRLKQEVLTDLPDKLEKKVYGIMDGEQQQLYDAQVTRMKELLASQSEEDFRSGKIQILAELTKLRQVCCDPGLLYEDYKGNSAKLDLTIEMVRNAVEGGHKILLFSQFTSMLAKIQDRLQKEEIRFYTLTGSTPKEERLRLTQTFNQDDTPVFCISLRAGGTGLNLAGADMVIHYDPWWNVAVQNQATDRAHRIGQRQVVSVYKLVLKGSIEEKIIILQEKKEALAEQVLQAAGRGDGSFSKEELLSLL